MKKGYVTLSEMKGLPAKRVVQNDIIIPEQKW